VTEERLDKVEKELRSTQDNVLLIHKDLQVISSSLVDMATAMKAMAEMQSDMKVFEERMETRSKDNKEAHTLLHNRIDTCYLRIDNHHKVIEEIEPKVNSTYGTLIFIAKALGGAALTMLFGLVIWAIKQGGA